MNPPFEIFAHETEGSVLWRGTAGSLEDAKAMVEKLCMTSPGVYVILDRRNGIKTTIPHDGATPKSENSLSL